MFDLFDPFSRPATYSYTFSKGHTWTFGGMVGGKVGVPGIGDININLSGSYQSARGTSLNKVNTVTWPTSQMERGYVYKIVVVVEKIADVGTEVTSDFNGPRVDVSVRHYEVKPTLFTGNSNFMVLRRKCK